MDSPPPDAIAAVTHPDPYPFYAGLVARRPMYRDEALGLWVASSAAAVTAVLHSDLGRVRPPAEPVPTALLGSPAAEIFRHLVRMTDGSGQAAMKRAVAATIAPIDPSLVARHATRCARHLVGDLEPARHLERVADYAFRLPVFVVASLLGVMPDALPGIAREMDDFVRCLAPSSTPEQIERGTAAAGRLRETFGAMLRAPGAPHSLAHTLAREARAAGRDDADAIVANAIGFMSQAYEATAGLIGNTLLALARLRGLRDEVAAKPALLPGVVREVVRHDPPVQNTRRFVARDGVVAGQRVREGDAVLVVLAAANRDPAANADPDRFDANRRERQAFTFGTGVHACPGEALATAIAHHGVERLLASGLPLDALAARATYRASANTRVPLFAAP